MHCKGVCHRDLKPGNFLLDDYYHLKLIDFGTSKIEERGYFGAIRGSVCIEMDEKESSAINIDNIMKQ
jgi:serine/threonine protein kinase